MNYPNVLPKTNLVYGVNLVDGPEAVKQAELQPNQIAVFIDRNSPTVVFYLKSSNEYGMTKTLAAYEGNEVTDKYFSVSPPNMDKYVTKDDLKSILTETLKDILGGKENECASQPDNGTTNSQQSNNGSLQNNSVRIKY